MGIDTGLAQVQTQLCIFSAMPYSPNMYDFPMDAHNFLWIGTYDYHCITAKTVS